MTERRRLETWKEIANYLGRGVRTVQRWEKHDGLPVHREAGGRKESVFAWSDELDAWRAGHPYPNGLELSPGASYPNDQEPTTSGQRPASSGRSVARNQKWLVLIPALGILPVVLAVILLPGQPGEDDALFFKFHEYDRGSQVDIYNANNIRIKSFRSGMINFKLTLVSDKNELRMLKTIDLDEDGWLDIVFADLHYSSHNRIYIYLRQDVDTVQLARSWSLGEIFEYEGERFGDFGCEQMICEDLNDDGTPEIVVGMNSHPHFPSLCRIYDLHGAVMASIYHPGRINNLNVYDRDGDGRKELYVAATNNFLAEEFSAPVMYVVENDWETRDQEASFFGENRSLAPAVTPGFRVIYVCLKRDRVLPSQQTWESAWLGTFAFKQPAPGPIMVQASPLEVSDAQGPPKLVHLRSFYFDSGMNFVQSYIQQEFITKYSIDISTAEVQDLLRPMYWNGHGWQEDVCTIPMADAAAPPAQRRPLP
ncbi:MAG: VCBS repeat-containing protein [Acidobacteria bacterium]|nr:VCBS repeat-containing protein [Acidobacteriota bacterium]